MVARTGAVPTKPEHFNGKTKKQGGPAFAAPPRYCGDPQICPAIQVLLPRQDSAISAVLIPLLTSVLALLASALALLASALALLASALLASALALLASVLALLAVSKRR